eukprot:2654464-Heterocapsa_arctica.AAC.1
MAKRQPSSLSGASRRRGQRPSCSPSPTSRSSTRASGPSSWWSCGRATSAFAWSRCRAGRPRA